MTQEHGALHEWLWARTWDDDGIDRWHAVRRVPLIGGSRLVATAACGRFIDAIAGHDAMFAVMRAKSGGAVCRACVKVAAA
jgi:hypothetical protein